MNEKTKCQISSIAINFKQVKNLKIGILMLLLVSMTTLLAENIKVKHLTQDEFIEQIFDYRTEKEWKYKGTRPVLIDFYANWCAPCRQVAPVLSELQKDYGDKLQIYKVNVDREKELSAVFGVEALPSFLFIPVKGMPSMSKGVMPRQAFVTAFKEYFGIREIDK